MDFNHADSLKWFYLDYNGETYKELGPWDTKTMHSWYKWGYFSEKRMFGAEFKVRLDVWSHHYPLTELYPDNIGVFEDNPRLP